MLNSSAPAPVAAAAVAGGRSSASTIAADMETGSHDLTVRGYSGTKGHGVGKYADSAPFTVAGHRWSIRYFPDGNDAANADYLSVFLQLEELDPAAARDAFVLAEFTLSLLDHDTREPVPSSTVATGRRLRFTAADNLWGYRRFIKRKVLEESAHVVKDDTFRLRCHVTVVRISAETTPVEFFRGEPPPTDLHRHLGDLLDSGLGADVRFRVGRETFAAHRSVLAARSPVFKAELFGWMKEMKTFGWMKEMMKTTAQVRVDDMEPRVFGAMLRFIYTDSLPEIDEGERRAMAQHLLVAADRYHLERLKLVCEDLLRNFIDTDTAATTLTLAEQHDCQTLKQRCFSFLKYPGNMRAVLATDSFEHLMSSCPSLLKELIARIST